jgi:hypothetical protein
MPTDKYNWKNMPASIVLDGKTSKNAIFKYIKKWLKQYYRHNLEAVKRGIDAR